MDPNDALAQVQQLSARLDKLSELVRRLASRLVCSQCGANATAPAETSSVSCGKCGGQMEQRTDDNEAVVLERLEVYKKKTMPLLDYYRARPTFRSVNGAQTPEGVAADLAKAVDGTAKGAEAVR